jgi:uncharacterized protein (TIGR00297 family)
VAQSLDWQSKAILLIVVPTVAVDVLLQSHWWISESPTIAVSTLGLSAFLGLVAWRSRSATPLAAASGAELTASLMFSTGSFPYRPWQTALTPVLAVLVLTSISTRLGRRRKEQLGTAEPRKGRVAAQVAANLGAAALLTNDLAQNWLTAQRWLPHLSSALIFAPALAALCEAAADTVSSELGQVLSTRPRMITTLRVADAGTDGAISVGGTLVGILAAAVVASASAWALRGGLILLSVSWLGGIFGLIFDSLLGATLERRGWLNNDAVNFLSTLSAAAFALLLIAILLRLGLN